MGVGRSGKCEIVIITLYLLNVTTLTQDHTETTHSIDIVLHVIGTYITYLHLHNSVSFSMYAQFLKYKLKYRKLNNT